MSDKIPQFWTGVQLWIYEFKLKEGEHEQTG